MRVKTSELTGAALDWVVAKCGGLLAAGRVVVDFKYMSGESPVRWEPQLDTYYSSAYSPSTNWAHGGPIIEREGISTCWEGATWVAYIVCEDKKFGGVERFECTGPTPLIAAMRCYVAFELGEECDIPDELITGEIK